MRQELENLFRKAVVESLAIADQMSPNNRCTRSRWKRHSNGWLEETVDVPNLTAIFYGAQGQFMAIERDFHDAFLSEYPEYRKVVSLSGFGGSDLLKHPGIIVTQAIEHAWRCYKTFALDDAQVDSIVSQFSHFIDNPHVRLRFRSLLINFDANVESVSLPSGVRVRRLESDGLSELVPDVSQFWIEAGLQTRLSEFCIEGEIETTKEYECNISSGVDATDTLKTAVGNTIRSLVTFKEGAVGHSLVHLFPVDFCPLHLSKLILGDHIPKGKYVLDASEVSSFKRHAEMVFSVSDEAMEMACSRLADAELRTNPRDRLIDSVIGMERILLSGLRDEDRRGELRFRFAMHYSTMYELGTKRRDAFRTARSLYDLRSAVAHGGNIKDSQLKIGGQKMSLNEASKFASQKLRHVIKYFLPAERRRQYRDPDYWYDAIFTTFD